MLRFLSTILFPASCLCCSKRTATEYLCEHCESHLPRISKHICPACQKSETRTGEVCMKCYGTTPLAGTFAALSYRDPIVSSCVETLKYRFVPSLAAPLGRTLAKALEHSDVPLPDIIIPVPLHTFRYRWRGFNQAELIAREMQQNLPILENTPIRTDLLKRRRFTKPQAKKAKRQKRLASLAGAFAFIEKENCIQGRRVWLVDDVSTTNATLTECARPLAAAGAEEIWGIVAAR